MMPLFHRGAARRFFAGAATLLFCTALWVEAVLAGSTSTPPAPAVPAVCEQMNVVPSANPGITTNDLNGAATLASNNVWAVGDEYNGSSYQTLVEHWDGAAWSVVASPSPGSSSNDLYGVAALASNDVWAVGFYRTGSANQTLVEHWNGTVWSVIASPSPGSNGNSLNGVAARASNDVWAVGYDYSGSSVQTLVEHWDGTAWSVIVSPSLSTSSYLDEVAARASNDVWAVGYDYVSGQTLAEHWDGTVWAIVASPNPGSSGNYLSGVSARASNDVWAVGGYHNGNADQTLVEHWNGTAWSVVASPSPSSTGNYLSRVAAWASNDVWAVGTYIDGTGALPTLVEHWDGAAWSVVPSPSPGSSLNVLYGVAALATDDVWAVGRSATGSNADQTLAMHWNGTAWSVVTSPNPSSGHNRLYGVSALASNDVWAVGDYHNGGSPDQTLVEHWNGTAWSVVASPNPGSSNVLYGVSALASNDAWAVGSYNNGSANQTLVEHWNGTVWSVVASPSPGSSDNLLQGVAARASNDVWAVGYSSSGNNSQTLVEHWNGTTWSVVASPSPGSSNNLLQGVAARASNDVWAVGSYLNSGEFQTLVEHWNGSIWSVVTSPSPSSGHNILYGVSARASNDVWAVGYDTGSPDQTLVEHWDGTTWSVIPSPSPGAINNVLNAVSALASNDVWAVGFSYGGGHDQTLVEHWNGTTWSQVPSLSPGPDEHNLKGVAALPGDDVWAVGYYSSGKGTLVEQYGGACPTATLTPTLPPSSTATSTPPLATATPSATATPLATLTPSPSPSPGECAPHFADVQPSDYFYAPVLYLYCHGVISGYADGTFRPYSNTTRGQMVKIVALGFALPVYTPPAGAYTFADVPPPAPFWSTIESAAHAGVVGGYTCGGPGEPCDAQQRPYFRPNVFVTRGQLAKIVVVAAGWAILNPAAGSFADVTPGSAFYPFVETAACYGIISGYACGGPGEPCDAQHRPYFRQYNNAVRGQIAKIVYLALTGQAACAAPATPSPTAPAGVAIDIYDNYFSPAQAFGPAGSTFVWVNRGAHTHTVTSDTGAFDSGPLAPGASFSFDPDASLVVPYPYHSTGDAGMTGTIYLLDPARR